MKIKDIRKIKTNDLQKNIEEFQQKLVDCLEKHSLGELKSTTEIKAISKTIARLKTIQNESKGEESEKK